MLNAFDEVIGHGWARRALSAALRDGRLAQSHLLVGPTGIGKTTLARALAAEALAVRAQDGPRARTLALSGRHPDLTWVAPDDGSIKVETIRELLKSLALSPVEGGARVAVLDGADTMTESAENALLKTLEEPNPSVVLILTAPNEDNVLPTVVSRCQVTPLRPVATDDIEAALLARGIDAAKARRLARLARGRPGWALGALADPELLENRERRLRELLGLLSASRTERFLYAEKLGRAGDDDEREATLETWLTFWRDLARHGGADVDRNGDFADAIDALSAQLNPGAAFLAAAETREAMKRLRQNARPQLVFDALMLRLPRLPGA